MTYDPSKWDTNSPSPPADLNDPAQYEVATQLDANGFPFVETPGDLGYQDWRPITGYRNARTGAQIYGAVRVGRAIFTGGKSADGSPTKTRRG
ncbi:MAG: hypothetical protein AAF066_03155 [Pseudomonadota bacterium]